METRTPSILFFSCAKKRNPILLFIFIWNGIHALVTKFCWAAPVLHITGVVDEAHSSLFELLLLPSI